MRSLLIFFLLGLCACTQHNPASCADGIPCGTGLACDPNGTCVVAECTTRTDCASPDKPICEDMLCVGKCTTDDECVGISGRPYCATDGVCEACLENSQCSADSPVCDAASRSCRGCTADAECDSGVCLEDLGTCVDPSRVIFVTRNGPDTGACTSAAPCGTLPFALSMLQGTRDVIHIIGGTLTASDVALDGHNGRIDGEDTVVTRADAGSVFTNASGNMTLTGLRIGSGSGPVVPLTTTGGHISTYGVDFLGSPHVNGGTLEIHHTTLEVGLQCNMNGKVIVDRSSVHGSFQTLNCEADVTGSRFEFHSSMTLSTTLLRISNNLFLGNEIDTDPLQLDGTAGSYFQFNTVANSAPPNTANSLICNAAVDARNNIIAWKSTNAVMCASQYSLFDTNQPTVPTGQGNLRADAATFFVDIANSDVHLAAGSPALDKGTPTTITTDYDGATRANPPDIGAYESH